MSRRQLSASNPTSGSSVQSLGACVVVGVLGTVVGPPGAVVVVVVTVVVLVVAQFSQHGSEGFSTSFGGGAGSIDAVKVMSAMLGAWSTLCGSPGSVPACSWQPSTRCPDATRRLVALSGAAPGPTLEMMAPAGAEIVHAWMLIVPPVPPPATVGARESALSALVMVAAPAASTSIVPPNSSPRASIGPLMVVLPAFELTVTRPPPPSPEVGTSSEPVAARRMSPAASTSTLPPSPSRL